LDILMQPTQIFQRTTNGRPPQTTVRIQEG
jgi:hypothetical protein